MKLRNPFRAIGRWPLDCRKTLETSLSHFAGFSEFRIRHRARPLCDRLEAASPLLAELAHDIEERFLSCGRALQEQVKLTARLTEQSRQLNQFDARSSPGETWLQRVGGLMATHLDLSEQLTREVERLATTLERYADHLQHLLHDQQQLERSFAPMRVLHSFFRIESATLAEEQQALFHAVTAEMQRLHTDVSASFAKHVDALTDTRDRVLAAATGLHVRCAQHFDVTKRKRADVQRSLSRLESQLNEDRERNRRLESAIAQLDRETDRITVGLQFQDITRQKMEHVQAAASTVLDQFANPDRTPFRKRARAQQVLCQVQAVQLGSVQEELAHATDTIVSGLRALLDHLRGIEQDGLSLESLNEITAGMDATLNEMRDVHRVTAELTRSSLASLAEAIQTARGFAHATTGATDTMRRLAADLLLMGLNAQVQALQAKSGCLEVLSSAVSKISSEAGSLTIDFERKLAATTETLTRFVQNSQSIHDRTEEHHRALHAQDETVLRDFAAEHETARAIVADVGALLHQLRLQADDLLSSVDLAEFSREPIAQSRELFAALADVLARATAGESGHDDALLADVENRYTMKSERAAHAAVVGSTRAVHPAAVVTEAPASLACTTTAATATGSDEQLGDNVELF